MTNAQYFASLFRKTADQLEAGQLDKTILAAARSPVNDTGWMYALWCDDCGDCGSGEEMCPDEAQLGCIRRFLERQHGSGPLSRVG